MNPYPASQHARQEPGTGADAQDDVPWPQTPSRPDSVAGNVCPDIPASDDAMALYGGGLLWGAAEAKAGREPSSHPHAAPLWRKGQRDGHAWFLRQVESLMVPVEVDDE